MTFRIYVLYSEALYTYHIGQKADMPNRLFGHNNSGSKSTKKADDWEFVYQKLFETRAGAYNRETEIKKRKVESILNR